MMALPLFDPMPIIDREPHQLARRSDPETSHEAAAAITPDLRELQRRVLAILNTEPMTQHTLIAHYRAVFGWVPESTVRTRCSELVDAGLVIDTGQRVVLGSGRRAIVWGVRPGGPSSGMLK